MTSEQAAAAERLRVGEYGFPIFNPLHNLSAKMMEDLCIIRDAFLSEHLADDDKEIDFDVGSWLQSIGFGEPTINGWPVLFDNGGCDPIEFWLGYDGNVALLQSNTNDHVLIGVNIKTRGQLRRLCAALGIPLRTN